MLDAMKAVQDGSPITTAARVHSVPKTSLHNRSRIKGKVIHGVKSGPKQYLSAEEVRLKWLLLDVRKQENNSKTLQKIMAFCERTRLLKDGMKNL